MKGLNKRIVGKALALLLEKPFLDLDEEIVRQAGMSIPEIFKLEEEKGFRVRETAALKSSLKHEAVIATGGGIVVTPENLEILKDNGLVVYLRADVETQYQRTKKDNGRPMLYADDRKNRLQQIFDYRDPLYKSISDMVIDSGRNEVRVCVELIKKEM